MSLGPVNNQISQATQQPKAVDATKKAETAQPTTEAKQQPTCTPEEAAKASPETQDAKRQMQQGNENQIRNQIEQGGEWLEARGRKRGGRGGRTMAQAPTRGLGGGGSEIA